jgi:spermidine dehydrogenase
VTDDIKPLESGSAAGADPGRDRELGMDRDITRRDFLNGIAVGAGGLLAAAWLPGMGIPGGGPLPSPWGAARAGVVSGPQDAPGYYPPARTGMRGSHPGSYEVGHAMRDGTFWKVAGAPVQTGEHYDLVVVGGGISGLSTAHFYRARNPSARILILDNHDDFGGHAKRNEFRPRGRLLLTNGGTWSIESPFNYSPVAAGLLTTLGIDPPALEEQCSRPDTYRGLESAVFFDHETFGADRLVTGVPSRARRDRNASTGVANQPQSKQRVRDSLRDRSLGSLPETYPALLPLMPQQQAAHESAWRNFLAKTPLAAAAQRDIVRIQTEVVDYMPGLTSDQKKDKLWRMSYKDYLLHVVKADPGVIPYYQTRTHGLYGIGIDAVPAQDCWAIGLPGFEGLALDRTPTGGRLSFTAAGDVTPGKKPYFFHFPDGNASIARLLVRSLVPGAIPGSSAEDIVTARVDYAKLDRPSNGVRIRLNSTVVGVKHTGADPVRATEVDVTYARSDGTEHTAYLVRANDVVLASWNMMIPYICPDLPGKQKDALKYGVKVPLVYTGVAIKSRRAFDKLGVHTVATPGMFHSSVGLDVPVSIGAYEYPSTPDDPVVVRMERTPCQPGLSARDQQRIGQADLLGTPFEVFERSIRDQLGRVLGGGGFDPARDIDAITVNRWPHGYAYEYNPLWDPAWPPGEAPNEIARRRFGRIAIACEDAAAASYTDQAIDQGYRAVEELVSAT